jgi:TctA family transporter
LAQIMMGVILGPSPNRNVRRAMPLLTLDRMVFVGSCMSRALIAMTPAVVFVFVPLLRRRWPRAVS